MFNKTIIIITLSFFTAFGALSLPGKDTAFTKEVTELIIKCQFDSAAYIIDQYRQNDVSNPLPPVLKLAALGMRDVDLEMTVDSLLFMQTYAIAIGNVTAYEKKNGTSSYSRTMIGFTKAIHASFYLRRKMYVTALQNGLDALKVLREAKELDTSNTDVDFFLGLYDYARAELRARMWWVMFWYPGNKKEGIKKLELCGQTAYITRNAARLSLSNIYTDEKERTSAKVLIDKLYESYPDSRFVFWSRVKYFEAGKMYVDAASVYNQLSFQYSGVKNGIYNSLVTKKREAEMYKKAGMNDKVNNICKSILGNPLLSDKNLRKETEKLLESVNDS